MGRLTSHFDYCELFSCPQRNPELAKVNQCNFFNTTSRDKCHEKAVYDKLREYEDLEEQVLKSTGTDLASMVGEFMHYYNLKKENRLLELPCKVEDAPAIEAVPVVYGKWFDNICSSCQLRWDENMVNNADDWGYFNPMPNFCPNCGADMRRKVQE